MALTLPVGGSGSGDFKRATAAGGRRVIASIATHLIAGVLGLALAVIALTPDNEGETK